jgi:hypothetical protein
MACSWVSLLLITIHYLLSETFAGHFLSLQTMDAVSLIGYEPGSAVFSMVFYRGMLSQRIAFEMVADVDGAERN